jgi:hypothetical protein
MTTRHKYVLGPPDRIGRPQHIFSSGATGERVAYRRAEISGELSGARKANCGPETANCHGENTAGKSDGKCRAAQQEK